MDKWFILSNIDILLLISDKIRLPIQLLLSDSVDPSGLVESVKLDKKCLIISITIFVSTV